MRQKPLAIDVIARYLARRDYSVWELQQRLQQKEYSIEEIEAALDQAGKRRWLLPPEQLSQKFAKGLHARGKSYRYIANFLAKKRLPQVEREEDLELEKAREIISKKFKWQRPFSFEQKKKVLQFLRNRTYDEPSIRTVINEIEGS